MFQQEADSRDKKGRAIGESCEGSLHRVGVGYGKAGTDNSLNLQHWNY